MMKLMLKVMVSAGMALSYPAYWRWLGHFNLKVISILSQAHESFVGNFVMFLTVFFCGAGLLAVLVIPGCSVIVWIFHGIRDHWKSRVTG